jgi:hypothetical protein
MITQKVVELLKNAAGDVSKVVVEYTLDDGTDSVSLQRAVGLYPADPADYTPYDQLTEEEVLSWVSYDTQIELNLESMLADLKEERVTSSFPWE